MDPHCVAGDDQVNDIPVIGIDYGFLNDRGPAGDPVESAPILVTKGMPDLNPDKVLSLPEGSLELASAGARSDFHESMEVQLQRKDDRWSSVLSIFEGKLEAVAFRVGVETFKYVLNISGKGKIHLVRNAFTTVCGWEWHDH